MKKFVIEYKFMNKEYDVIWKGEDVGDALDIFWSSFDWREKQHITDVRIYDLVERICETEYYHGVK